MRSDPVDLPPVPPIQTMPDIPPAASPRKTLVQRMAEARACSPEEASKILATELRTPSQRFWGKVLAPWCGPLQEHYREVVNDFSRCRDLDDIKNSIVYWRQRTPRTGFLGEQFRVHTAQALEVFARYMGN